jgi:putative restriction endonuclease
MCTLHHKVLDRGGLGIDDELRVIISNDVNGRVETSNWLHQFHGQVLLAPQRALPGPDLEFVRWHRPEVFKQV